MNREDYQDYGAAEEALFITEEEYDAAIVGVTYDGKIVYDADKIIEILQADCMTEEEAVEYFDYNIAGSYMGEYTPVYITMVRDV